MPSKDPEKRKAYKRKWRELHRERERQMAAQRRANSPKHFKEQDRVKSAQWRARHPEKARTVSRRSAGLPEPTRPETEWCECCGRWFLADVPRLDHDHCTGEFRGWLCHACNTGIGMLGDSLEGAEKAVAYLKRAA